MFDNRHMTTSVAVVTYNRARTISSCVDSLERQSLLPNEIIILDSSNNRETGEILKDRNVVYRHAQGRLYQPQARNLSLNIANGDIIAFLDDDVVCSRGWLENIIEGFSYDNTVGVGGPTINCDQTLRPLRKIKISERNQNFFTSYGDIRFVGPWVPPKPTRTELMGGGNMSFLTTKLKEVGGFDEHYGRGGAFREETDPQILLIKRGYKFMYMPKAIVFHLRYGNGGVRSDNQSDHYYWCGKYHKFFADKYFPKWSSRLSWIFWSIDPPCLWVCVCRAVFQRNESFLKWIKGLWW